MTYLKVITFFYEETKRVFHHFEILPRAGLELHMSRGANPTDLIELREGLQGTLPISLCVLIIRNIRKTLQRAGVVVDAIVI